MEEVREFVSKSENETKKIAQDIASGLSPRVVLLRGDLGAGKTVFAKGFVDYFVKGASVVSPTFTIMNSYADRVFHFDLYRIESASELDAIGAEEYLFGDNYCLVEWPDRVGRGYFPTNAVEIEIVKIDEKTRAIRVENI